MSLLEETTEGVRTLKGWIDAEGDAPALPSRQAHGFILPFSKSGARVFALKEAQRLRLLAMECGRAVFGENAPSLPEIETCSAEFP